MRPEFLSWPGPEEEGQELLRVKSALRECRSDLNNLEVAKDRCSEAQSELKNKIKELENKISDLDAHEHLLLVRFYILIDCIMQSITSKLVYFLFITLITFL